MSASRADLHRLRDEVTEARMHCICARLAVLSLTAEANEQNAVASVLDALRDRLETIAAEINAAAQRMGAP